MGVRLSDSFYFASFLFIFCMNVVIYRALLKQTRKGGHINSPNLLALSDCVCGVNASFVFFLFHLPWDYCIYGPAPARVLKFDPSNRLHPNCM